MKRILKLSLIVFVLFSSIYIPNVKAAPDVTVQVDTKAISFPDAAPYINEDNRTMVPIRFVAEALGAKVSWEKDGKQTVTIEQEKKIFLKIGEKKALVNGEEKEFDTRAVIKDDRTFVPLRFVSETLNCEVFWKGEKNLVEVFNKKISCGDVVLDLNEYEIEGMDIASDYSYRKDGISSICGLSIIYGKVSGVAPLEERLKKAESFIANFADNETVKDIMNYISQKKDDETRLETKTFESDKYKIRVNGFDGIDIDVFKK